ncbi:carbamate kinase [Paenibacillus dendritiformis]|uniref:carbamate kinase n=1 Tax=Paenibacillus dendritiformis TaxID=130049 RepID=UPI002A127DD6|nr:carbamate kinase [Paenibacillus dendritiformis]
MVAALGGNAILQPGQEATYANQLANVRRSCCVLARLVEQGHRIVITHGNGPQVGNLLRQQEEAQAEVPPLPLDVCTAQSQGFIGFMIQQLLRNELASGGRGQSVVSLITRVEVAADDPAFRNPSKPIGSFYTEEEAKRLIHDKGWQLKPDANRGWRRVVPSPRPQAIVEAEAVRRLLELNQIVIACGGGGIPVVRQEDGAYAGVEAVIDKDFSSCKLAREIEADVLLILTDVEHVYAGYGGPEQRPLATLTPTAAARYIEAGHFSEGSMRPKVEAAASFAAQGGTALICALDQADLALSGLAGTRFVPETAEAPSYPRQGT